MPLLAVICGVLLLVADTLPQQVLRNLLFDQYQRWQPRAVSETAVRIVDIDEESLARLGQWPWPRTRLAELVDKLRASTTGGNARTVIAFDILFAEADRTSPRFSAESWRLDEPLRTAVLALPDHDEAFARSLARMPVVLGLGAAVTQVRRKTASASPLQPKARFVSVGGENAGRDLPVFAAAVAPLPLLGRAAAGLGTLSLVPDVDGIVRRVPLAVRIDSTTMPALVSETLRVAAGVRNIDLLAAPHDSGLDGLRIGTYRIPTTTAGELWLHYRLPAPVHRLPAWRVLADPELRAGLAGKIVLIGASAQGLLDLRFSPFGPLPGVDIHAQALEQIFDGHFLERPGWARGAEAITLMLAGLAVGVLALRARALVAVAGCVLLLALLFVAGWLAFTRYGLLLDTLTPALGILLSFSLCSLAHHLATEHERRWLKTAFARYVSPNRVDYLIKHPESLALGGRRQQCSFIFTDLAGFTSLIERIEPSRAVALLNAYIDALVNIVFRHEGTLDRIVGDALVVMFSAPLPQPDHPRRALACALEMDAFANRYAAAQQARGIAFGKTRIGVHAGEVIVGNFGGSTMFDYRALGDPINTAARLESVNKQLGTRICVSAEIVAACPEVAVRPVGRLVLKGKHQPLAVFEPQLADLMEHYAPLADYQAAFAAMQAGRPEALALFTALADAYPDDPLVAWHRRRLAGGATGDLIVMQEK